jgi:hypothetical protein
MLTVSELQDKLNSKKTLAISLSEKIISNQKIKDQYSPRLDYARELGQDLGPIVLKLQSLNYTDPIILQNNLDRLNLTISNLVNQIESMTTVFSISSRLGIDGTPDSELISADSIEGLIGNRDAELAVNNPDIKIDSGEVPQLTEDWPTEGWA